jgi:hypothetical protein
MEDEMGGSCGMDGGEEGCKLGFYGKAKRKETSRKTQT